MTRARVIGSGVAGLTTAYALADRGFRVELVESSRRHAPVVFLNELAIALIERRFGRAGGLRDCGHVVSHAAVRWQAGSDVRLFERDGLAVPATALCDRLRDWMIEDQGRRVDTVGSADWNASAPPLNDGVPTVLAAGRPAAATTARWSWGTRQMLMARVHLRRLEDQRTSMMVTSAGGWLYLLPSGSHTAILQVMVPSVRENLAEHLQRMIAEAPAIDRAVAEIEGPVASMPAAPSLAHRLRQRAGLAAGDAAMACDPLCGDGVGNAVRGGLLAAAVLEAVVTRRLSRLALAHYRQRLHATMATHLRACLSFYSSVECPEIWRTERAVMSSGLRRLTSSPHPESPLRLLGDQLVHSGH